MEAYTPARAIAEWMVKTGTEETEFGNMIFYKNDLEDFFPQEDFSKRSLPIIDLILSALLNREEVIDVEIESDPDTDEFKCFDVIFGLDYCPRIQTGGDDAVNHPSHYTRGGIECIEAIRASMTPEAFQGYCKGNVMKYIWRASLKNGVEDLKKAQVYLGWMIESMEKANE